MFDQFNKAKEKEMKEKIDGVTLSLFNDIRVNSELLINIDVTKYSQEELSNIISDTYGTIFDLAFNDSDILKKFLSTEESIFAFTSVMYNVELDEQQRIQLCNIIFGLRNNVEPKIKALLMNLSAVVNRNAVPILLEMGFDKDLATDLVTARYSSTYPTRQVSRINKILLYIKQEISEDLVIKVWEKFGYFKHFSNLFDGVMYDQIDVSVLSDTQKYNYGIINNALLSIVEEMPDNLRYTLLINFAEATSFNHPPLRFNLKSCNRESYPRLNYSIDILERMKKYIPTV